MPVELIPRSKSYFIEGYTGEKIFPEDTFLIDIEYSVEGKPISVNCYIGMNGVKELIIAPNKLEEIIKFLEDKEGWI